MLAMLRVTSRSKQIISGGLDENLGCSHSESTLSVMLISQMLQWGKECGGLTENMLDFFPSLNPHSLQHDFATPPIKKSTSLYLNLCLSCDSFGPI